MRVKENNCNGYAKLALVIVSLLQIVMVSPLYAQQGATNNGAANTNTQTNVQQCIANQSQTGDSDREQFMVRVTCMGTGYRDPIAFRNCAIQAYDAALPTSIMTDGLTNPAKENIITTCQRQATADASSSSSTAQSDANNTTSDNNSSASHSGLSGPTDPILFTQTPGSSFVGPITGPSTQNLKNDYADPLLLVSDKQTAFSVLVRFFLGFAGLICLVYLVFNGMRYAMSRGEDAQIGQAKKGMTYAIVGLLIILAAYTIVATILNFGAQPVSNVSVGVGISF